MSTFLDALDQLAAMSPSHRRLRACALACMRACVRACVRARVYVGVRARLRACVHTCECVCARGYKCVRACAHSCACSFIFLRARMRPCECARQRVPERRSARVACVCACVHENARARVLQCPLKPTHRPPSVAAEESAVRRVRVRWIGGLVRCARAPRTATRHSRPPRRAHDRDRATSAQDRRGLPVAVCCAVVVQPRAALTAGSLQASHTLAAHRCTRARLLTTTTAPP
jgi:hypothetical protein